MSRSIPSRLTVGLFPVAAVLLVACEKPAEKTSGPATLTLSEYSIQGPATVPSGINTFHANNIGKELHHATLVKLASGKTLADFQAAMAVDGPPPEWVTWMGGPQMGSDVTVDLAPGNYVWLCLIPGADGKPHVTRGMIAMMTVNDEKSTAKAPTPDITVAMKDYQWDVTGALTAGKHTVKLDILPGQQPHEFAVIRLADGKKAADVMAWLEKMDGPPPATNVEGTSVLQPGQTNLVTVDLKPGNYAIFCFVADAKDKMPHAMHGMVKEFTVQ